MRVSDTGGYNQTLKVLLLLLSSSSSSSSRSSSQRSFLILSVLILWVLLSLESRIVQRSNHIYMTPPIPTVMDVSCSEFRQWNIHVTLKITWLLDFVYSRNFWKWNSLLETWSVLVLSSFRLQIIKYLTTSRPINKPTKQLHRAQSFLES
jgi:hypothetical protein